MITIRLGKLFCNKYNKENSTSLTPKEIFCDVMAPLVWGNKPSLYNLSNSAFFYDDAFTNQVKKFCDNVESNKCYNLMTSTKVYGGCAEVSYSDPQTTYCLVNDNLYYTLDERYCSFIGMLLQVCISGFYVSIYNEDIVWLLYQSIKEYRKFLDCNEGLKGNKLSKWNSNYFTSNILTGRYDPNEFVDSKGEIKSVSISRLLIALAKGKYNVKFIGVHNLGQTNITAPMIMVNTEPVKNLFKFYNILVSDTKFGDTKLFDEVFGNALIYKFIETGAITNGIINHSLIYDMKDDKMKKSELAKFEYKQKILESIMTKESKEIAKELGILVAKCYKLTGNKCISTDVAKVFTASNVDKFIKGIMNLQDMCNKYSHESPDFSNVIDYMTNDMSRDEFFTILTYANYQYRQNL